MNAPTPRDPWQRRVDDVADLVLGATLTSPPTLGAGRLVCVDGPAGAGKSTLGAAVVAIAATEASAGLLHVDDILDGWSGLPKVGAEIGGLLEPLAGGKPARYRSYDWVAQQRGTWATVPPVDLLCLEGVGAWSRGFADLVTTLVWVDLPEGLRRTRAARRDQDLAWWDDWAEQERSLHRREGTRARADVLVEGDEHELTVVLC